MIRLENNGVRATPGPLNMGWPGLVALLLGLSIALLPVIPATIALAPFVALLIFIEPLTGVAFMLLIGPWGALENVVLGNRLLDSGQILFFVTTGAWLAHSAMKRRIHFPTPPFLVPLLLFIGLGAVSLLEAPSPLTGFVELFKWVEVGVIAMIVIDRVAIVAQRVRERALEGILFEEGGWRIPVLIILVAGVSQALIGIWQFGLRGTGPEHFQIIGGAYYRAYGTFEQPNPFGGFMAWMAALSAGALLGELIHRFRIRRLNREATMWMAFLAFAAVTTHLALLFSWSRGSWLGYGAAVGVMLLLLPSRRSSGLFILVATLFVALAVWQSGLLPASVADRLSGFTQDLRLGDVRGVDINNANYAVLERLAHWQAAADMAQYNLWRGVGIGNYEAAYPAYALINWPQALGHAHNYYLNILAETGVPGFSAYLCLWALIMWQTLRVIATVRGPQRGAALGLMAVWMSLSVHHLLDKLYVNNLYLILGAMLGLLQILDERTRGKV